MLRVSQVKLPVTHTEEELEKKLIKMLHIEKGQLLSWNIWKQSLDARRKPELYYVYTLDAEVKGEASVYQKLKKKHQDKNVECCQKPEYHFPDGNPDGKDLNERPYVIGCGPAGIFCTYFLAEAGYRPVLIEQGAPVEDVMVTPCKYRETASESAVGSATLTRICPSVMVPSTV